MEHEKLLPCPFCGEEAKVSKVFWPEAMRENYVESFTVGCKKVGCPAMPLFSVFECDIPKYVERWNTRWKKPGPHKPRHNPKDRPYA